MQKSIDNQPKIKVLGRLNIKGLDIIKRVYSAETTESNRQEKP